MTAELPISYGALIREAFIEPIRSVLIVDDQYPTVDEILGAASASVDADGALLVKTAKAWARDPEAVGRVLGEFRQPDGPYLLDVHDGSQPPEKQDLAEVHRLQQTDLLVLDYELETGPNVGKAALAIARGALTNRHFNLILVHTEKELDAVFGHFALGLLQPCSSLIEDTAEATNDLADEVEAILETKADALRDRFDVPQYLDARRSANAFRRLIKGEAPWGDLSSFLENEDLHRKHWRALFQELLSTFEADNEDRFSSDDIGLRDWSAGEPFWIRCDQGFIAFKRKSKEPLLPVLLEALEAWKPLPSRLVLTKLRAEMNKRGVEVQDDALGDRQVGAAWYHGVLSANSQDAAVTVERIARNHAEQLLDHIVPEVGAYAARIAALDADAVPLNAVKERFEIDLRDDKELMKARMGHNAFKGSKPVRSSHLELGHIFRIDDKFWMCVTPACDMFPGRERGIERRPDNVGGYKKFNALALEAAKEATALNDPAQGGFLFANIAAVQGGETTPVAFSVVDSPAASPAAVSMYAENDGRLAGDTSEVMVRFVASNAAADDDGQAAEPTLVRKSATVCGHLRYEYALEVQARLNRSLGRIGLEYEKAELEIPVEGSD